MTKSWRAERKRSENNQSAKTRRYFYIKFRRKMAKATGIENQYRKAIETRNRRNGRNTTKSGRRKENGGNIEAYGLSPPPGIESEIMWNNRKKSEIHLNESEENIEMKEMRREMKEREMKWCGTGIFIRKCRKAASSWKSKCRRKYQWRNEKHQ